MSAQSLASFCCSSRKCWCSCASSQAIARSTSGCQRRCAARQRAAHVVRRDQPPQRGIDAAEVPEVGIAALRCRRTSGSGHWRPDARPACPGCPARPARARRRRCRTSPARRSPHRARRCACSAAPRPPRWCWPQECRPASGFAAAAEATRWRRRRSGGPASRQSWFTPHPRCGHAVRQPENRAADQPPATRPGPRRRPVI